MQTYPRKLKRYIAITLALICIPVWCLPAYAISIKEEEQLAHEFMKVVARHFDLIEDPLIVSYVNKVGKRILAKVPPQPFTFHFYVIKSEEYNAFAIPAGHIFINSGLLAAMDDESELAGILAHEISHVVCRHISQRIERSKKINLATLAGLAAGIFLGVASGDASAMQAMTVGSAAAAKSASLAYSREDEAQADQMGLDFMDKAGYPGSGFLKALKKIRDKQWFGSGQIPSYMLTHPAVEERITDIDTLMAIRHKKEPEAKPTDEQSQAPTIFDRVNVRLIALYSDQDSALQYFSTAYERNKQDPMVAYGYGLALARAGKRDEAVMYLRQALTKQALDPVILSDLGRVYFLDGRYEEALDILEGAVTLPQVNPEAFFYLGRTYMELNRFDKAAASLEKLLASTPDYRAGYQLLGEAYGRLNNMPEAHYYLGMFHFKKGDFKVALYHLQRARKDTLDPAKRDIVDKALKSLKNLPDKTGSR